MWFLQDLKLGFINLTFKGKVIGYNGPSNKAIAYFCPVVLDEKLHASILAEATNKISKATKSDIHRFFKILTMPYTDDSHLNELLKSNSLCSDMDYGTLLQYRTLFWNLTRNAQMLDRHSSRNVNSACEDTRFTTLQIHGDTLIVTQNSVNLNREFYIDTILVNLLKTDFGIRKLVWLINIPYVLVEEAEKTIKWLGE